jgi:hypothetical protein
MRQVETGEDSQVPMVETIQIQVEPKQAEVPLVMPLVDVVNRLVR